MGVEDLLILLDNGIPVILNEDQGSQRLKKSYLVTKIGSSFHLDYAPQEVKIYDRMSEFVFSERDFNLLLEMIGKDDYSVTILKPEEIKIPAEASVGF